MPPDAPTTEVVVLYQILVIETARFDKPKPLCFSMLNVLFTVLLSQVTLKDWRPVLDGSDYSCNVYGQECG